MVRRRRREEKIPRASGRAIDAVSSSASDGAPRRASAFPPGRGGWAALPDAFQVEIVLADVIDVTLVALLLTAGIVWLRRSRARLALLGLAILAFVYAVASELELQLTAWVLQGFFAVLVIVLVVIFQDDLRQFFEQIALWGLRRRPAIPSAGSVETLVRAVTRLVGERRGALLVFPGSDPIERHVEGGIALDALLSEPLLLSLFDPHSPGHDGAAIVQGDRVTRFAVHLPLSHDEAQLRGRGTRHAAALGLAERTSALCVVVSEERGTVSLARAGELRQLPGPEGLTHELRRFLAALEPEPASGAQRLSRVLPRWREGLLGASLALLLWVVVVPGSRVTEVTRRVPVEVQNLPEGYELLEVEPAEVEVTVSGRVRDLYLAGRDEPSVRIDAFLVKLGRRNFELSPGDVQHARGLSVVEVKPGRVRLRVSQGEAAG
jgi:uncharacterized protein (TIGR00159 family)